MIYYIGDTHFGHSAVIGFDNRPFENVEEMDRQLIALWNSRVTSNDEIYILGDFAFRNEKTFSWYLKQLKGKKHLIVGNHDGKLLKDVEALNYFASINYYLEIADEKRRVILSHYPLAEWNGFHRQSYHVYGHIHGNTEGVYQYMKQFDKALNAGCMINNYLPVSLNELIENNNFFKNNYSI